jgi:uncharacterized protein (DUF302 family)
MNYGYSRTVDLPVDAAIDKVTSTLSDQGFGVLTTIDVKATLKKKLDVDRRPYVILGACNPNYAHQALEIEEDLGLLLPCNVVVYEGDDGKTVVAAIDAGAMMSVVGNDALEPVAESVNPLLRAAIDAV